MTCRGLFSQAHPSNEGRAPEFKREWGCEIKVRHGSCVIIGDQAKGRCRNRPVKSDSSDSLSLPKGDRSHLWYNGFSENMWFFLYIALASEYPAVFLHPILRSEQPILRLFMTLPFSFSYIQSQFCFQLPMGESLDV